MSAIAITQIDKKIDNLMLEIAKLNANYEVLMSMLTERKAEEVVAAESSIIAPVQRKKNITDIWKQEVIDEKIESGVLGRYKGIVYNYVSKLGKADLEKLKTIYKKDGLSDFNTWTEENWKTVASKYWTDNIASDRYKSSQETTELHSEMENKKTNTKSSGTQLDST